MRRLFILGSITAASLIAWPEATRAQQANVASYYPAVATAPMQAAGSSGRRWLLFGHWRAGSAANSQAQPGIDSNATGTTGLPRGRRYYNGRYFGSFNNRFYSPQYGYF
jgi:hypothetical protein